MKSKNHDYIKMFKPCMIVALILIVASAIIFGIFGFNKGFDFTGGTQLVVQFELAGDIDIEKEEDFNNASKKVLNILNDNSVAVNSFQTQGEYGKSFVLTFKSPSEETLKDIRVAINKEFNTSEEFLTLVESGTESEVLDKAVDITRQTSQIDGFVSSTALLTTIAALAFSLMLLAVYSAFRLGIAGALAMVASALCSVVGTLCFVLLARVEVNTYIFVALGLIMFASVYACADLLFGIKSLLKDPQYENLSTYELSNLAVEKTKIKRNLSFIFAIILALIVGVISVSAIRHLAIVLIAGMALAFATNIYLAPAIFAFGNKTRGKVLAKQVEENNTDSSAPVVEIK